MSLSQEEYHVGDKGVEITFQVEDVDGNPESLTGLSLTESKGVLIAPDGTTSYVSLAAVSLSGGTLKWTTNGEWDEAGDWSMRLYLYFSASSFFWAGPWPHRVFPVPAAPTP